MEFSLKDMIELFLKRIVLIIIVTILSIILSFLFSKFVIKPTYTASVKMYVNPNTTSIANINDLTYAQKVVNTYVNFLQTKTFYNEVIETVKLNYTMNQLEAMTEIRAVNNTEIFVISVTSLNPNDSYQLVKAMEEIAPSLIRKIKYQAEISVVDPAVLPTGPSSPNIIRNTMIGGIFGLIVSAFIVFLWELMDVKVKNEDDLLKKHDIILLGTIPTFDTSSKKDAKIGLAERDYKENILTKTFDESKKFIITEAYKSLRTNLFVTLRKDKCRRILITSTVPEEGKSTTSLNIAIAIAQTGARVLLMDCDLRRGTLHTFFNINRRPGLSDVLSGLAAKEQVMYNSTYDNLKVISMGTIFPNPSELVVSVYMNDLLDKIEKDFDYIIMDTPPINVVSDAISLSKLVDGVVVIVRENVTTHTNINIAQSKLKFVDARILGYVLNDVYVETGKKSKYNYYYSHETKKYD